jgi:hypothetical protein
MTRELIVTNGDAAVEVLRKAGIGTGSGDVILPWRDVLYEGPVPHTEDLAALSAIRADYLTQQGWATGRGLQAEFRARDVVIADHAAFDLVTLWFEHDLYDMLQILQVLDFFAGQERDRETLRIVHCDKHLTRMGEDELRAFAADPRPVGQARLNQATEAWGFWRDPIPKRWCGLAHRPRLELKHLWHAVLTSTGHFPAEGNGLTVPQRRILFALTEGQRSRGDLFAAFSAWCDGIGGAYMSDLSFYGVLDGMFAAKMPAIARASIETDASAPHDAARRPSPKAPFELTELGRALLAGHADYAAHNTIDAWHGGTHITNANLWRRDTENFRLHPPR